MRAHETVNYAPCSAPSPFSFCSLTTLLSHAASAVFSSQADQLIRIFAESLHNENFILSYYG